MDKDCGLLTFNPKPSGFCALTCVVGDVVATCRLSAIVSFGAFHISVAHSNPDPDVGSYAQSVN